MKQYSLLLLLIAIPGLFYAQRRHALKADLTALVRNGARIGYEFKLNQKSSLELSIGFQKHETQPDWLFNGDQIVHYLQRKTEVFDHGGRFVESSGWQNVESQPLPDAPEHLPLQSANLRLGWRFNFYKDRSKWHFFLQPGLQVSNLRYFEIKGGKRLEWQNESITIGGIDPYTLRIESTSALYEQTRFMRNKHEWFGAFTYDLGFVRKLGKHLFLEGRLSAGGSLTVPYKSPRPPVSFRGLWAEPLVMVGWKF